MAKGTTGANLGFEDKLWAAADKLRGNMDAAEQPRSEQPDAGDRHAEPATTRLR